MWDAELIFSNRQTLTDGESDTVVDTGGPEIGLGGTVQLQIAVDSECSGTLTVGLDTADNEAMTGAVRVAQFIVGADRIDKGGIVLAAPLPSGCKRYLRLQYSGASGGHITAGLTYASQTSGML